VRSRVSLVQDATRLLLAAHAGVDALIGGERFDGRPSHEGEIVQEVERAMSAETRPKYGG
jgi:hypothetical protein